MSTDDTRDFAELAAELGHGAFNLEASRLLAEVVERIRRHGGTGNLTIRLNLEDVGGGAIEIDATFRTKKPHAPIPKTKVWSDEEGLILVTDPHQEVLPFRKPKARD